MAPQEDLSPLEQRYRAWLRLLPAPYREVWQDDLVATFLDGAEDIDEAGLADAHPTWSEAGSVVALAVRLRLGAPGATPRAVALGAGLRLLALVGLLAPTILSFLYVDSVLWTSGRLPGVAVPLTDGHLSSLDGATRLAQEALLLLPVAALLAAFHRDAPPVRRTPWLAALVIGVVVEPAL